MKQIPLKHGKIALVDDEDYERVSQRQWRAFLNTGNLWYAVTGKYTLLHRFILAPSTDVMVDHKNGNGLDCRRTNMRLASNAENQHNAKVNKRNKSGFRGVSAHGQRWRAQIKTNGITSHLGVFTTATDAALAYDDAVRQTRGEFGRTNF